MAAPTETGVDRQAPADDLYLLAIHEPYYDPGSTQPINTTIVHARTLLHPGLPQPDAAMIYRCLTEFPGRIRGQIVPLSTITHELDGGRLWSQIGDWASVIDAVPALTRSGQCDACRLSLPPVTLHLLINGPETDVVMHYTDGTHETLGPADRAYELDRITAQINAMIQRDGPLWPGSHFATPSQLPASLPYRPRHTSD